MRYLKLFPRRWLIVWVGIYVAFLILDIFIPTNSLLEMISSAIKYVGIFLAVIYVHRTARADNLLLLALLFTFLADTVLIWTQQFVLGIFIFCFAHFFHIARFTRTAPKFLVLYYLIVTSVFVFALSRGAEPIYAIAIIYGLSLITNIVLSSLWYKSDPENPRAFFAAIGFLFFFFCDLSVAIQFFASEQILPASLYTLATFLVWAFYYPAQVLISNSSTLVGVEERPVLEKSNPIE